MTMRRFWVFCVLILLAGCGLNPEDELSIEYGKTVRKVGIFPVYPPREEFQIGDVYMWSQSVADPNDTVSIYLTTIPWLRWEADRFMSSRIVFEDTATGSKDKAGHLSQTDLPEGSSGLVTREQAPALARTLPIAAFPSVTADAGFTSGIGLVEALAAVGLAGGARTTVTLNFKDVRTYWAPSAAVFGRVRQEVAAAIPQYYSAGEIERERLVRARRGAKAGACGGGRLCGISVVTRVYLTRSIDYTYRNARIVSAAIKYAETAAARPTVPNAPDVVVNVSTQGDSAVEKATLDTLRTEVDTMTSSKAEGASFQFTGWDARGVTFSSTFQRPVVVGWDGIELGSM